MANKYVIIMATYNRKNGKTPDYLHKSLNSIYEQTNKEWDLIIISDKYEPIDELTTIISSFNEQIAQSGMNNNIILLHNNEVERDYIVNKRKLWYCAGAASMNKGLAYARDKGYKYYLHLDDDDYWHTNHIKEIDTIYSKYDDCIFVNTKSTYISDNKYLPAIDTTIFKNNMLPTSGGMIHSSISFRLDIIDFNYNTSRNEKDILRPSDALLLTAIKQFIRNNNMYCSIYVPILTCRHSIEANRSATSN